jgi:protocatechuate 3,4-dioxygenase beta subunit
MTWKSIALGMGMSAALLANLPGSVLELAGRDEPGTRLVVAGLVRDGSGRPVAGAEIHVYQTDAAGRYTKDRPMDEPHARLSGWVHTDAQGRFELRTLRPGGYPGTVHLGDRDRKIPAHIHLDVSARGYRSQRLQAVFADDPRLADPHWQDWVKRLRQPVVEVHGAAATVTITLEEDRPRP